MDNMGVGVIQAFSAVILFNKGHLNTIQLWEAF